MLQLYIDLALSRLARHAIQPIQLYSYTAIHAIQHTALYILPLLSQRQEPAVRGHGRGTFLRGLRRALQPKV